MSSHITDPDELSVLDDILENSYLMRRKRALNDLTAAKIVGTSKSSKKKPVAEKQISNTVVPTGTDNAADGLQGTVLEWPSEDEKSNSSVKALKRDTDQEPKRKR